MVNLLGAPGSAGPARLEGLEEALRLPGVSIHLYGKHECRPFRKMGHVTVTADDADRALDVARAVRGTLRIRGERDA